MKITVISDTHIRHVDELQPEIISACLQGDLIIHCGDFTTSQVLTGLLEMGMPFKGVKGNSDHEFRDELPTKELFEVNGFKIGIIHGWGGEEGLEEWVRRAFRDDKLDLIIYGHSHDAVYNIRNGLHLFNPGCSGGAPVNTLSYGLITIDRKIDCRIVRL